MILSDAYKNDILSKNTQLVPLVIIEKFISEEMGQPPFGGEVTYERIFLSTHNIQVDGHYFKPLLLNMPNLSQNIDLDEGKFQTSSLTLNISNTDYNNSKRISDNLDTYSLMNAVVCIHYKSQSCNKIQLPNQNVNGIVNENTDISSGCPRVFTGVVRDIQHQRDTLKITVEDITDKRITRELPNDRLGDDDNIPDKYKNTPIPMLYGRVENAPTVALYTDGRLTYQADNKPIHSIHQQEWGVDGWGYNQISIHKDGQYIGITNFAHWSPHSNPVNEGDQDDGINYFLTSENVDQYDITEENKVAFNRTSMLEVANRVECLKIGVPKNVVLEQNHDITLDYNPPEGDTYTAIPITLYGQDDSFQHIEDSEYKLVTDKLLSTFFTKDLSNTFYWSNEGGGTVSGAGSIEVVFSLQWDSGVGGADYVRVLENKMNGFNIPVKGDANMPSGWGVWDRQYDELFITPFVGAITADDNQLNSSGYMFDNDQAFEVSSLNLQDLISMGNSSTYVNPVTETTYTMPYNENADIKVTNSMQLNTNPNGSLFNTPSAWGLIRLSSGNKSLPNGSKGWSSFEISGQIFTNGNQNNTYDSHIGGDMIFNLDMKLKELEVTALAQFNDAKDNDFYLNAGGRTDDFLFNYEHFWSYSLFPDELWLFENSSEILENPVDVIRHILVEECGLSNDQFDEDEFSLAWSTRQGHPFIAMQIKIALSVNEFINSKELLQNISQNSMVYPRFKNDGKMGFVSIQKGYYPEYGYNSANEIDNNDIISYKFGLSKELISKIDVKYGYDYAQGKSLKTTDSIEMTAEELDWNGISNVEDNYLNYEAKYINDEQSAIQLRDMLWYDRKSKHLEIDLTLPLSYMNLEIGDLCKFPDKLIDGIKAHGIDYTVFDNHGGSLRIPLFKVIKVNKSLDNVKITLHQLHWLADNEVAVSEASGELWESVILDNDFSDPMLEGVEEEEFDPYAPAPFIEFKIGWNSSFSTTLTGGSYFPSSYSREFIITDQSLGTGDNPLAELSFNLIDNFDTLFGSNRFGLSSWNHLIPSINSDGFGYGNISIGNNFNQVGGFIAMEIRMTNANGYSDRVLSLRNIAGTEFDSDIHDSSTTIIPDNITPSTTELKLGWVLYVCDSNWNYLNISGNDGSLVIDDNLNLGMHPTIDNGNILTNAMTFNYNMILYPYQIAVYNMQLTYGAMVDSQLLQDEFLLGDINEDGNLSILDLTMLMGVIMGDLDATENADMNEDGIVDILDVLLLINIILGNE